MGLRDLATADAIVQATLEAIEYLEPDEWFMENPDGGLSSRPFMDALSHLKRTTSYCKFGSLFRKDTNIWSKNPMELPRCESASPCKWKRQLGYHLQTAQSGSYTTRGSRTPPWTGLASTGKFRLGGVHVPGSPRSQTFRIPEKLVHTLMQPAVERLRLKKSPPNLHCFPIETIPIETIPEGPTPLEASKGLEHKLKSLFNISDCSSERQRSLFRKQNTALLTFDTLVHTESGDVPVVTMFDCGSNNDIISSATVSRGGFPTQEAERHLVVRLADGTAKRLSRTCTIKYTTGAFTEERCFWVLDLHGFDIIWGMNFADSSDVVAHFRLRQLNIGQHVLVSRDQSALPSCVNTISGEELKKGDTTMMAAHIMHKDDFALHAHVLAQSQHDYEGNALIRAFYLSNEYVAVLSPCQEILAENGKKADGGLVEFITKLKPEESDTIDLSKENHKALEASLWAHKKIAEEPKGLPRKREHLGEHAIVENPHTVPPCFNSYRMYPAELLELKKQLDFLLEHGYIRPSNSPYGAPVLFAPKKDGALRLCLDYRGLNNQTVKDKYPLPRDQDIFDQLQGARFFSSLDALWGYWQIRIAEKDVHKTSIRTPLGSYEFLVMPFGLTNAPATFQRFMENVLRKYIMKFCMVYIDDIIIYSKTAEEHMQHIELVLQALDAEDVKIKLSKCNFFRTSIPFLGHIISRNGIAPQSDKVKAIQDWPEPKSVNETQQFMGLVNYYRRHVNHLADVAAPLTGLSEAKGDFRSQWTPQHSIAFKKVKEYLASPEVLALPDMSLPFLVKTDASKVAVGGSLHQIQKGEDRVIAFESKKLLDEQTRWPTHERELFAMVHCFKTWRHYVQGSVVTFIGDHKPLKELKTQKHLSDKQARWLSFLESFDYSFDYIAGKLLIGPDGFSRRPDYLNVLSLVKLEPGTSYSVWALADERAEDLDSSAPNHQVEPIAPEDYESATSYDKCGTAIGDLHIAGKWFQDLKETYLKDDICKKLLAGETVLHYQLFKGLVYHSERPRSAQALLYIPNDATLRNEVIAEVHDVPFQGHFSREKTVERLQRYFYWPNMTESVRFFLKSCDKCNRHKYATHKPSITSVPYNVPDYPWDVMCMDEKSGLPMTPRGNNATWVFVDRLSRRGHAIPCPHNMDTPALVQLWLTHVFKHHGVPHTIISDRGPQFTSNFWSELWSTLGTGLNIATTNNPQTDGGSERFIKTLIELVSSFAERNPTDWDTYLPAVEFAYNDSMHPETGFTPFEIDIGRNPNTPIQLLMHGFVTRPVLYREDHIAMDPSEFLLKVADTLKVTREKTRVALAKRKEQMEKGVKLHEYKLHDFVYMKHPLSGTPAHTSLLPNYVGPFEIIERVGASAYKLRLPESMGFKHPVINERKLKPFLDRASGTAVPTSTYPETDDRGDVITREPPLVREVAEPATGTAAPPSPPKLVKLDSYTALRVKTDAEGIFKAQLQTPNGSWHDLTDELKAKRWRQAHSFVQQQQGMLPTSGYGHLWKLVAKHFRKKKYLGYVTEHDPSDPIFPIRVVYSDGDEEDLADQEIEVLTLNTLASSGHFTTNYWIFPPYMARLYSTLTRPYELDAMEHEAGISSVAPYFCSENNSVFIHQLDGLSVWCNPDFKLIEKMVKFFLKTYARNTLTAMTMVVPVWLTSPFWKLLSGFRLLDFIPKGTHLFRRPDRFGIREAGDPCDWGPTRWDVVVLYYGAEFQPHRLFKALGKSFLTSEEKARVTKVVKLNYTLTGDPIVDESRFETI